MSQPVGLPAGCTHRSAGAFECKSKSRTSSRGREPPEKAVHLTGDSMLFRRDARTVQILGTVHAQQTSNELTAESLLLELDEAFHARRFVASGHPQMRDSDVQGPMALDADEISAALTPEGSFSPLSRPEGPRKPNTSAGEDGIGGRTRSG